MNKATQSNEAVRSTGRLLVLPLVWVAVFAVGVLWMAPPAGAEPYMTVREGYKCSQCHVNKGGGGVRTDYARVYTETRLAAGPGPASFGGQVSKDADVGYGRITPFVSVGADLRTDFTYTDMDHATPVSQFNRTSVCGSCHASQGGGKLGEVSVKLEAVPNIATLVYSSDIVPATRTREAYVLLDKLLPADGYVMFGTFRLPSGFQNTWDSPFQHGDQGGYGGPSYGGNGTAGLVGLETVRAKGGMAVGFEPGPFALSVSISNPDDPTAVGRGSRVVANGYAVGKWGVLGLGYATDPIGVKINRTTSEVYLGFSLGRITALGQIDTLVTKDENAGATTKELKQQAWLGEVDLLVKKGHNLKLVYEARDPNLDEKNDRRDRTSFIYEPFMTPYLQGRIGYRQLVGPIVATDDRNGMEVFGELHFMF